MITHLGEAPSLLDGEEEVAASDHLHDEEQTVDGLERRVHLREEATASRPSQHVLNECDVNKCTVSTSSVTTFVISVKCTVGTSLITIFLSSVRIRLKPTTRKKDCKIFLPTRSQLQLLKKDSEKKRVMKGGVPSQPTHTRDRCPQSIPPAGAIKSMIKTSE